MKCIVNYSTPNYSNGQKRLEESLKGKTDADFIGFNSLEELGSPSHLDNPYAFKVYAIEKALQKGYTQILWLDSSAYAIKNVEVIFNLIRRNGHFMEEAGHPASHWSNDKSLDYFSLTREEAANIPLYSAGFTGLNFNNATTQKFFQLWKKSMLDGIFRGDWSNHRHDLTCASIIAHKLGMKYQKCGKYFQYAAPHEQPRNNTVVFFAQGIQ